MTERHLALAFVITFVAATLVGGFIGRRARVLHALGGTWALMFWIVVTAATVPGRGPDLTVGQAVYNSAIASALLFGVWSLGVLLGRGIRERIR